MLTLHYASYFRCMHNSTHTCQPVLNGAKQAVLVYRGNASAREDKYEKEKKCKCEHFIPKRICIMRFSHLGQNVKKTSMHKTPYLNKCKLFLLFHFFSLEIFLSVQSRGVHSRNTVLIYTAGVNPGPEDRYRWKRDPQWTFIRVFFSNDRVNFPSQQPIIDIYEA